MSTIDNERLLFAGSQGRAGRCRDQLFQFPFKQTRPLQFCARQPLQQVHLEASVMTLNRLLGGYLTRYPASYTLTLCCVA